MVPFHVTPTHQSRSSHPALFPLPPSSHSSLFFSEDCALFSQRPSHNPLLINHFRTLSVATGGCTPSALSSCLPDPLSHYPSTPFPALITAIQPFCFHAITKCKFLNSFPLIFIHHWWGDVGSASVNFINYYFKSPGIPSGISSLPIALAGRRHDTFSIVTWLPLLVCHQSPTITFSQEAPFWA
jgi:hypothetical protein